ncbi:sugar phosphate nucleotidyltransferase [Paenibacillus glycinis]|uniref:Cupin domain-containing protein n=1 Tax=Paenibacillus glycinis TaxID=2697035 RepID=A0ABW9XWP8_9BACL|nr:sugar phosphate nucleotidyltransferase [Paenibacillus glycinis]NBD27125.1 cupin domain-containing protein [Paenibacillus glycinis]
MRIVLLSGGSGKRLWPLSNEIRSKLFLKLLPSEDGGKESMLQRICRQLDEAGLLPLASIVAHESQAELTQHQVGDRIAFLAEPYRRGTFTAAALAASYLHAERLAAADETICVMPADLFVEAGFFRLLREFPGILARSGAELALLGTTPAHPSSQYGYIVPQPPDASGGEAKDYRPVARFVEKPGEADALVLMKQQALWNCGVFAFPLHVMLAHLRRKGLPAEYESLLACYERLPEASFDVEIAEKTRRCVVIPYDRGWRDLGDWRVLTEYLGSSIVGRGEISGDSLHTHVVNELDSPVHVIGLSNVIVAASPDGILVADKDGANRIKQQLPGGGKPASGEKRWGSYRLLDHAKTGMGTEALTKKIAMLPGKNTSYHRHRKRDETWTVLSGTGEFILETVHARIQAGDVLSIPAGAKHAVKAITPLVYIDIQLGTELLEEDSERFAIAWEEILRLCGSR